MRLFTCLLSMCGMFALADQPTKADKLNGTWVMEGSNAGSQATSWAFENTGKMLKVTLMHGSEIIAGFQCGTRGKECEFKDDGKNAKVSMWFLGPKLVQLETKGNEVFKRRFLVNDLGDTMQVEWIPISPGGKRETVTFKRIQTSAPN